MCVLAWPPFSLFLSPLTPKPFSHRRSTLLPGILSPVGEPDPSPLPSGSSHFSPSAAPAARPQPCSRSSPCHPLHPSAGAPCPHGDEARLSPSPGGGIPPSSPALPTVPCMPPNAVRTFRYQDCCNCLLLTLIFLWSIEYIYIYFYSYIFAFFFKFLFHRGLFFSFCYWVFLSFSFFFVSFFARGFLLV